MSAPMPQPRYTYRARLKRVVDGDTCVLEIALGCFVVVTRAVRLLGINTPEVLGPTAAAGQAAARWAVLWFGGALGGDWPLVVETHLDTNDKYGRLLGTVYRVVDGESLNDALVQAGHAVPYDGHGARP